MCFIEIISFSLILREKLLNNIEYSKNVLDRLKEEQDAFNEFKNIRKRQGVTSTKP